MPIPTPVPRNAGWVLVLSYYDHSGIIATWGPFATENEAGQAALDLTFWPIERGEWKTCPLLLMPGGPQRAAVNPAFDVAQPSILRVGQFDMSDRRHEVYDPHPGCGHDGCGPWIGWDYHMSSWFRAWSGRDPGELVIVRESPTPAETESAAGGEDRG